MGEALSGGGIPFHWREVDRHAEPINWVPNSKSPPRFFTLGMANTHGVSKPLMTHETAPSLPRISVVIPTFNGGELLRRCLVALRAEQPPVHEIIVVDDASTDDSAVIAEGLGARVIRRTENAGPAAARNDGALVSTGEVISVRSDTELRPGGVRRLGEYPRPIPGSR